MSGRLVSKVGLMLLGLLLIVYLANQLKNDGISPNILALVGIDSNRNLAQQGGSKGKSIGQLGESESNIFKSGSKGVAGAQALLDKNIAWCRTRVRAIEFADGYRVEQSGKNWMVSKKNQNLEARKVDFLSVEKWFSHYCNIDVKILKSSTASLQTAVSEKISIHFIKGKGSEFKSLDHGASFVWEGIYFASDSLTKAFKELRAIE